MNQNRRTAAGGFRMASRAAISAAAVFLTPSASASGNLLVGGDFESVPPGGAGVECHFSAPPSVPGWAFSGGYSVDRISHSLDCPFTPFGPWRPFLASGGRYMLSLQGSWCCGCNNNGWIEQEVATIAGRTYRLSLDVALDRLDVLRVSIGTADTVLLGSPASEAAGWQPVAIEFTASGPTTLRLRSESGLGFTANEFGGCWEGDGCLLDNLVLVALPLAPCVAADIYRDGNVNGADLGILLAQWGPVTPNTESDLNSDGSVDGMDLGMLLASWGPCP